jgi:hypothetical protein
MWGIRVGFFASTRRPAYHPKLTLKGDGAGNSSNAGNRAIARIGERIHNQHGSQGEADATAGFMNSLLIQFIASIASRC